MKRYTESIPYELYLKFSDAIGQFEKTPTYAEVFDWLAEKGVVVCVMQRWKFASNEVMDYMPVVNQFSMDFCATWHDAANAAIDSALKLLANA